ncbi:MAG TPA: hypothetical protein VE890_05215 [Thermoguttaceae bacterium]|nr:hypothetical protein [Thermoguttaceae bacterium]
MKHSATSTSAREQGLFPVGITAEERTTGATVQRGRTVLQRLLEAYQCAGELKRSVWDFAVEIEELQRSGCTNSEIRWLVCKGFVAHAREIPAKNPMHRAFDQQSGLAFDGRTCFALTEAGVPMARSLAASMPLRLVQVFPGQDNRRSDGDTPCKVVPKWDHDLAELHLGDRLVKRFRVPAVNQEKILAAFEEERWPVRIDDPLPPRPDQLPKRRLHDTINALNRNQKFPLIRFLGDGRGEGVRWKVVKPREMGRCHPEDRGNDN